MKTLERIYGENDVRSGFIAFTDVVEKQRQVRADLLQYMAEWDTLASIAAGKEVKMDDRIRGFLLLESCNLELPDSKLAMDGLDYTKGDDGKTTIYPQVKNALRRHRAAGQLNSHKGSVKKVSI